MKVLYLTISSVLFIIILFYLVCFKKRVDVVNDFKIDQLRSLENKTVLDKLEQSVHGYQVIDCFNVRIPCSEDVECANVCNGISWLCNRDNHYCELVAEKPRCVYGQLKPTIDNLNNKSKYNCLCTSMLHHGVDCSKPIAFCDKVRDAKCICDSENILFMFNNMYPVCIPEKHSKLFLSQDNFKTGQ